MNVKHKGAWAEAIAKAYLLKAGFEVFENVSAHGPIDFIVMDPGTGNVSYYDVKLTTLRRVNLACGYKGTKLRFKPLSSLTDRQRGLGVQLLHVTPGGNVLTSAEAGQNTPS